MSVSYVITQPSSIPSVLSKDEFDSYITNIKQIFGEEWLAKNTNNVINQLWNRNDQLSNFELYILTKSILKIQNTNNKWIKDKIKEIKQSNDESIVGNIHEIIGSSFFNNQIEFKPQNNKLVDYEFIFNDEKRIRVSCKSFIYLGYKNLFDDKCNKFLNYFKKNALLKNINNIEIFVQRLRSFPNDQDWDDLFNNIEKIFCNCIQEGIPHFEKDWWIRILPIKTNKYSFSQNKLSYFCLMISPFHNNVKKTIINRLIEYLKIFKDSPDLQETEKIKNFLYLHLPEWFDMRQAIDIIKKYLNSENNNDISGVILLQSSIIENSGKPGTHFYHAMITKESINQFIDKNKILIDNEFDRYIFKMGEFTENKLVFDGKPISINNSFIFQKGDYYFEGKAEEIGNFHFGRLCKNTYVHFNVDDKLYDVKPIEDERLIIL